MIRGVVHLKEKTYTVMHEFSRIVKNRENIYYIMKGMIRLPKFMLILRNVEKMEYIIDISSVHVPARHKEFKVFYILNNLLCQKNLFLFFYTSGIIPSLSTLYKAADWLEREVFDLFGIKFSGHMNLRRILTDYGFKGFALRKDFPVFGYKELCYDFELRQVVYNHLKLTQNWRHYFFQRQWGERNQFVFKNFNSK